jgi:hypothetical protein
MHDVRRVLYVSDLQQLHGVRDQNGEQKYQKREQMDLRCGYL